jgi:hypothetical protein
MKGGYDAAVVAAAPTPQKSAGGKVERTAEEIEDERNQKEALKIVGETFGLASSKGKSKKGKGDEQKSSAGEDGDEDDAQDGSSSAAKGKENEAQKSGGWSLWGNSKSKAKDGKEQGKDGQEQSSKSGQSQIPDSFEGMVRFNAGLTGANMKYIEVMLRNFPQLVNDVCMMGTLEEQTDFIAMEIRREVTGDFQTASFRACLFSSLAALIPRQWNSKTEQAWGWFWESVDSQLKESLRFAAVHEKAVLGYVKRLQKADFDMLGSTLWRKLFAKEREAEMQHKQPTATFIRIATLALQFCALIFEDPTRMKSEITQHALKHILHQVEIRLFGVFTEMMEVEIREHSKDESVTAGIFWALSIIASLMARVMKQTSNPVLVAAVKGDVNGLKKALKAVSRGDRANSLLYA